MEEKKDFNIDDILLPEENTEQPRKRRRNSTPPPKRSGRSFMRLPMLMLLVFVVLIVILSFADVGGNIILNFAQKYLSENYKIALSAENITGNPIKGYTLHNFEIADENNSQKILSAGFLSGRVNFPALFTGRIRLAEISLGGIDMDVDQFIKTVQNLKLLNTATSKKSEKNFGVSAAFAAEENPMPEIPVDRFSLKDSRFSSQYGIIEIAEIGADLGDFDIDIDGKINNIPLKGFVDMGENAGLTGVNKSELNFGSGKILATGGLSGENLDVHASFEKIDLSEMTALYPELLKAQDFEGKADLNVDITGRTDDPRVFGTLDYNGRKIYGFPVERVSSNFNYSDNRISLSNIQANVLNIPVQGEFAAASRPDSPVSVMIKLDGSEANLDGLDKVLKIPELKALSGKISLFNANISGPVDSLNGLVNFTAPKIAYDGRALTNIKAQMKLAKSDTAHVDGKFNFEGANGYLQGSVASLLTSPNLNLTAKIADLDIKRIENMIPDASEYKLNGKITASVTVKGKTSNPTVSGSLNSQEFSGWGQKILKPVINFSFANKNLTISKTEGTLNGMPVNLSGNIGPLPSSNPNLNINATIAISPAALKNYVPDIDNYALKGNINAGIKIQGSANNPSVNLLASSPNLQAMNMLSAKNIELTTDLDGDLTKLENIRVNISAKSIAASGVTFSNVSAVLNKNSDKIILAGFNGASGSGTVTGAGSASISGKNPLDFNFRFTNLALAPLASASGLDLKGNLSGTLKISGSNSNPAINLNANVPVLNAQGFSLNNLAADVSGNMQNIKLNKVHANVEGAEITATGNVQISPAVKLNVAINGKDINLERLLREYPSLKDNLSGNANLTFNLTGTDKNISGKGSLTSSAIKAYGIHMTGVNLPLSYSGNNFASNNGTLKLYGGTAKNNLTFDINTMKFTDNIEASGIDVNALIQDVSGGLDGKITGTGKLSMKINGSAKGNTTYSGTGNFSMGSGAITGFKWLDVVTKLHNSNGIRYSSINAPLNLQTGKLILRAGSIVNANKNDALYQFAKLSQNGSIDFSGSDIKIYMMTESMINYQLINAIQGGSKGGLEALFKGGTSSFQDGLKAFLSGGMAQAKKVASTGDFRTVTLKISGKATSPSFSALKIGASTLKAQEQTKTQQAQTNTQKKEDIGEKLINKAVEKLIPTKKTETKSTQSVKTSAPANNNNQNKTSTAKPAQTPAQKKEEIKQKVEDKVKEELKKGLKKGLGGLFK